MHPLFTPESESVDLYDADVDSGVLGVNISSTWRIRMNSLSAEVMRTYVNLLCPVLANVSLLIKVTLQSHIPRRVIFNTLRDIPAWRKNTIS